MKTARWLILPALLVAACDAIVTDEATPFEPGTYVLVSIDGTPLPASEPCISLRIEEERITVGPGRNVEYHQRGTRPSANEVRTVSATGSYRATFDGRVQLNLQTTGAPEAFTLVLQRTAQGLTQNVGQPCDGNSVKLYQLQR
jgi:hypothetical protein